MKVQNKQIVDMLQAFSQSEVLKAIELYTDGISNAFKQTKEELKADGWFPKDEKPTDRESYYIQGQYWVQSDEMREKQIKAQVEDYRLKAKQNNKENKENKKNYTGQKMNLKSAPVKCPKCNASMYQQSICGGCKEGRKGHKIRLLCEDNPDHEILL